MSKGLYDLMKPFPMEPTTGQYKGVNDGMADYVGIIPELAVRLSDKLHTTLRVSVVPTQDKYLLIGNDLIGGESAAFSKFGGADIHSFIALQNKDSIQDMVQFVRRKGRPIVHSANVVTEQVLPEGPDEVEQLFLA